MLLFVTKVLVLDLYLIEKVLDVLDVFQVLELVLVLANMKKYLYLTQVLQKVLDPNPEAEWHIYACVCKIITISSDNGLLPGRRQAVIWTNAGILLTGPLRISFSEFLIKINTFFHSRKCIWKWRLQNGIYFFSASSNCVISIAESLEISVFHYTVELVLHWLRLGTFLAPTNI